MSVSDDTTTLHPLDAPSATPQRLSQSVVQVGQLLGFYRAEVARLLGYQCEAIGALFEGRLLLVPGTFAWEQALHFVHLYQLLVKRFRGDGPRIHHWLRAEHRGLGSSPFLLMVDEGALVRVVAYIEGEGV